MLSRLWSFLVVFCVCYLLETITFTYLISVVTSVERQLHIPSRQSGTLVSASDVGYVLTVVLLAHCGNKGNRARWIGAGCLLISAACLLGAMPGLLVPASGIMVDRRFVQQALQRGDRLESASLTNISDSLVQELKHKSGLPFDLCDVEVQSLRGAINEEKCKERTLASGAHSWGFVVVFGAIALIGVGHSMPWTLGMPLIDDNVSRKDTPFFFAGVFFIRILGPVMGFVIGGWANKWYVTLKPPQGLGPSDPGWIGAWWMGYLIVSATLFLPSIILICFPQIDFKKTKKAHQPPAILQSDESLMTATSTSQECYKEPAMRGIKEEIREFGRSIMLCLKSQIYLGSLLGRLFDAFAFKGFFVFQPKYLEHHYGLPQYKASFYMAMMGIVGFAAGVLLGSFLMRKFKLDGRRAALFIGVSSLVSAGLGFSLVLLKCDSINSQIGRKLNLPGFAFNQTCNEKCHCADGSLFPVCDSSGKIYFSPCHAGCKSVEKGPGKIMSSFNMNSCSCVPQNGAVSKSFCRDDCETTMLIYAIVSIISGIVSGSSVIPGTIMLFRSVPHDLRSVAIGFSGLLVSLISTFPSPIVFGSIIDTTCHLWETVCGSRGACQLYDAGSMRVRIHVFQAILRACGSLFDIWVWLFAKGIKLMEDPDDDIALKKLGQNRNSLQVPENAEAVEELLSKSEICQEKAAQSGSDNEDVSLNVNIVNPFGSILELQSENNNRDERRQSSSVV